MTIEPYEPDWIPEPPPPEPPVSHRRAVGVAVGALLLGAPAGLVWARLAPRLDVFFSDTGPGVENFDDGVFFQVDATYLIVVALAGVVTGLAAWVLGRRQGPGVALALAGGGLAAAWVARVVGERVVLNERLGGFCAASPDHGLCGFYDGSPHLRSGGLVVGWAVFALLAFGIATALTDRR